jgi:hypothetical protein
MWSMDGIGESQWEMKIFHFLLLLLPQPWRSALIWYFGGFTKGAVG